MKTTLGYVALMVTIFALSAPAHAQSGYAGAVAAQLR